MPGLKAAVGGLLGLDSSESKRRHRRTHSYSHSQSQVPLPGYGSTPIQTSSRSSHKSRHHNSPQYYYEDPRESERRRSRDRYSREPSRERHSSSSHHHSSGSHHRSRRSSRTPEILQPTYRDPSRERGRTSNRDRDAEHYKSKSRSSSRVHWTDSVNQKENQLYPAPGSQPYVRSRTYSTPGYIPPIQSSGTIYHPNGPGPMMPGLTDYNSAHHNSRNSPQSHHTSSRGHSRSRRESLQPVPPPAVINVPQPIPQPIGTGTSRRRRSSLSELAHSLLPRSRSRSRDSHIQNPWQPPNNHTSYPELHDPRGQQDLSRYPIFAPQRQVMPSSQQSNVSTNSHRSHHSSHGSHTVVSQSYGSSHRYSTQGRSPGDNFILGVGNVPPMMVSRTSVERSRRSAPRDMIQSGNINVVYPRF